MSENNSEIIDIRGILRRYLSKWYWFVISIAVCVGVGALISTMIKPKYEVRANVLLTEESTVSKFLGGGLSGVAQLFGGNSSAEDEVAIMTSHSVLRSVVKDLGLTSTTFKRLMPMVYIRETNEVPVTVTPDAETINTDTLRSTLVFGIKVSPDGEAKIVMSSKGDVYFKQSGVKLPADISTDFGRFRIEATPFLSKKETTKVRVTVTSPDIAAEYLREQLNVSLASKHSQIVEMQMMTDNEEYAINVLNALIANYNLRSHKDQKSQFGATADFINERLEAVRGDLNRVEGELATFKRGEGLGMFEADGTVMYERLAEAEKLMTQQQVLTEMARITLQLARESAKDNSLIPPVGDNENLSGLIGAYNNLVLRRMSVASAARPDNVALQRLDEQIKSMRDNLIATLETSLASSKDMEREYKRVYEKARGQISDIPEQEFSVRKIARDQAIEEQIYIFLLQKQEETNVLFNNDTPKARIIDEAYSLCEDESMSGKAIVLIAFILGLLIPPVLMFAMDFLRPSKPASTKE